MRIVAIADDLSGAAETGAALLGGLLGRGEDDGLVLLADEAPYLPADLREPVVVVDLDYRSLAEGPAVARIGQFLADLDGSSSGPANSAGSHSPTLFFAKIDSLWRGRPALTLETLVRSADAPVLFAPSLPEAGRVLRDGILWVEGRPLHESAAWRAEAGSPPESLDDLLGDLPAATVSLAELRGAPEECLRIARRRLEVGASLIVCEAESDDDLDRVVTLAAGLSGVRLVGSGGLAAALGRAQDGGGEGGEDRIPANRGEREGTQGIIRRVPSESPRSARNGGTVKPLFVVGTAEAQAARQVRQLCAHGVHEILLPAALLEQAAEAAEDEFEPDPGRHSGPGEPDRGGHRPLAGLIADIRLRLRQQPLVLTIPAGDPPPAEGLSPSEPPDAAEPGIPAQRPARPELARGLARVAAAAHPDDLVLIGGQTARFALDALGISALHPRSLIHHGAVASTATAGRRIVTRPGSFGDADSLLQIFQNLIPQAVKKGTTMSSPRIAVTMGDGAGIGPEVIVGALLDERTANRCRPIVIGDAERLRQAAEILKVAADVQEISDVDEAVFTPGRINVIDLGLLPADLPWGELSVTAGDAAYHYLRVASELAMAGKVEAICTAPLNKEALHAAGHLYPGHTELLAHFTKIPEVSMMLSTPTVKVIHVTTHVGLIDAVAKVNPALVERTIRRGHDAMVKAGTERPRIGVCGINPHAGEGGLFGYGEEEEKIEPGVRAAAADGIDVRGPLPADTLFFLAARGDYDLVVAMYHDQGHTPVKVLGIEAGVNITVGLPVIRTSVDHGTAFDIAGTGKADAGSMVEALRQATEMAPAPVG